MKKFAFEAVVFDLDGVITQTASLHATAWKSAFDQYLRLREKRDGEPFREFTHQHDYLPFVDGIPRYDGVKRFLQSRQINIPFGSPEDSPDQETICGLGNKKNAVFSQLLKEQGAQSYPSSIELVKSLRKSGIHVGVASSSKNCQTILQSVGIEELFETRVDGLVSAKLGLKGKPESDIFVKAARNLGVSPEKAVVVEDASLGVAAGRNGGFGLVLGVARKDNQSELTANGADIVVSDLSEIDIKGMDQWFHRKPRSLFGSFPELDLLNAERLVFFLDYDGTLAPIVERPELAVISEKMREVVQRLAEQHTVAIVSGRMKQDVQKLAKIEDIFYAGSHGFEISGPNLSMVQPEAKQAIPLIAQIQSDLTEKLKNISGVLIEQKKYSVAVHYRLAEARHLVKIQQEVDNVIQNNRTLRMISGKKVFEILPDIDWDKGKAVRWIMQALKLSWSQSRVIYIGDDTTDEDAFRIVRTRGIPILVADQPRASAADFQLFSTDEVRKLFEKVIT
ncbi:MAG: trehalose-phosphatase [Candidatus Omnitrophica bacterium]|nr:trehalose-phosphatase [Candidatus Omnitrophota bacterium]